MATTESPAKHAAPQPTSPRFTIELEFVLSLSNPYYLSHLAVSYPHLLSEPASASSATKRNATTKSDTPAKQFAAYLKYLYSYWKTPEYSRYLTHPGATLRALELLQQEQFRKDIIRPDVIERLVMGDQLPTEAVQAPMDGEPTGGKERAATEATQDIKMETTPG